MQPKNKSIKKGIDIDEARRKREENIIEIRKTKREEELSKRRSINEGINQSIPAPVNLGYADDSSYQKIHPIHTNINSNQSNDLNVLANMIFSEDRNMQYEGTQGYRKLLSIEKTPPIDEVIKTNAIARFVEFLERYDYPQLQFESAWALTNVASGTSEHTNVVIDNGAVPIFCRLLKCSEIEIREQAVWALGNIAGDSPACRDLVINAGSLSPLLEMIDDQSPLSLLRNCTWTLSNFCRGKPQPRFETVSKALPALSALLYSTDTEILTDACWALSYLSDGTNDRIQAVVDTEISSRLTDLLTFPNPTVLIPALRTVGNIVTGDDMQTDIMVNAGVLPHLRILLANSVKKSIRKEVCWTVSNITAGTLKQIQEVMKANIIPPMIHILASAEFDIKKEATWAISNATSGGDKEEIKYLVSCGCIPSLCAILVCQDCRIIMVALEGLDNILKIGDLEKDSNGFVGTNQFSDIITECGGQDKIESLQQHSHDEIFEKALNIIDKYFSSHETDLQISQPAHNYQKLDKYGVDYDMNYFE
jgi:hypothetical protein